MWLWHRRLRHPSFGYLHRLFPILFTSQTVNLTCDTFLRAKQTCAFYFANNTRVGRMFSLIHSDVWGSSLYNTLLGFRYYVLFLDDFSRMTWLYIMKHKSEVS